MKNFFDELDELVFICDQNYKISFTNKLFHKILGGDLRYWYNRNVRAEFKGWPDDIEEESKPLEHIKFHLKNDQSIHWRRINLSKPGYYLYLGSLSHNNGLDSDFLKAVLKEAHGPLSGIQHVLSLLAKTDLTTYQANCIHIIEDAIYSSINLLQDTFDSVLYERQEDRRKKVPKDSGMVSIVRSVIELLNPRTNRRGAEIAAYYHPRLPALVRVDDDRLKRLIFNLISECLVYSSEGVLVSVEPEKLSKKPENIQYNSGNSEQDQKSKPTEIIIHIVSTENETQYSKVLKQEFKENKIPWAMIVRKLIDKLNANIEIGQFEHGFGFKLRLPVQNIKIDKDFNNDSLRGRHICIFSESISLSKGLALQAQSFGAKTLEFNSRNAFNQFLKQKTEERNFKSDILLYQAIENYEFEKEIDVFPVKLVLLNQTQNQDIKKAFDGCLLTPIRAESLVSRISAAEATHRVRQQLEEEKELIQEETLDKSQPAQSENEGQTISHNKNKVEPLIEEEKKSDQELELKTASNQEEKVIDSDLIKQTNPDKIKEENIIKDIEDKKTLKEEGQEDPQISDHTIDQSQINSMSPEERDHQTSSEKSELGQVEPPDHQLESYINLNKKTFNNKHPKILVAEDNALNALLVKTFLENENCEVTIAEDGMKAIEVFESKDFDLVFLDMRMPKMDGLEVARRIRKMNSSKSEKPLVALTANVFEEDRKACLEAGMDDFLTKPIDSERLASIIVKWLQTRNNINFMPKQQGETAKIAAEN